MAQKIEEPFYKKIWVWVIAIVIVGGVIGSNGSKKIDIKPNKNSTKIEVKKNDSRKVTYEKFSRIKIDSSYEEAKSILGECKESETSEVEGIKAVIYTWYNYDNSNMKIAVKNNKVIGKAQTGLSTEKADVNLIKYTKIKTGMDYNKVKEILGDGELVSICKTNGNTKSIYLWPNSNGTNMNVTFQNGKVTAKNRLGLN